MTADASLIELLIARGMRLGYTRDQVLEMHMFDLLEQIQTDDEMEGRA